MLLLLLKPRPGEAVQDVGAWPALRSLRSELGTCWAEGEEFIQWQPPPGVSHLPQSLTPGAAALEAPEGSQPGQWGPDPVGACGGG